jgi:hypothetical protein
MSSESQLLGGWSSFNFTLSPKAKGVFDQTVKPLMGVDYTPLAFATQVVSGLNYCFLCEGKVVVPGQPEFAALIYVYAPLKGEPHIKSIDRINPVEK